ncbi:hypothetical protein P7K49_032732, partial [Saguinus oedipus]
MNGSLFSRISDLAAPPDSRESQGGPEDPPTPPPGSQGERGPLRPGSPSSPPARCWGSWGGVPPGSERAAAALAGRGARPALTRFLTSADSPYEGPLLNCVELMAGGTGPDGTGRDGTRRARGGTLVAPRAPPPPLIGPGRKCPYKVWRRRIPAAADFLSPLGSPRTSARPQHPVPGERGGSSLPLKRRETEAGRGGGSGPPGLSSSARRGKGEGLAGTLIPLGPEGGPLSAPQRRLTPSKGTPIAGRSRATGAGGTAPQLSGDSQIVLQSPTSVVQQETKRGRRWRHRTSDVIAGWRKRRA